MKRYKVVTVHGGVWVINCDDFEYNSQSGYVSFKYEGRNVAIFNLVEVVGLIEEDNGQ